MMSEDNMYIHSFFSFIAAYFYYGNSYIYIGDGDSAMTVRWYIDFGGMVRDANKFLSLFFFFTVLILIIFQWNGKELVAEELQSNV